MPPPRRRKRDETFGPEVVLALIVMVPLGLYRAFVVHLMWNWFVAPLGAPEIGVVTAWGIGLLTHLLTEQPNQPDERSSIESIATTIVQSLLTTTFVLVAGVVLS